jgi:pilus assembly protein CpaE
MADALKVLIADEDLDSRVNTRKAIQRAQLGLAGEVGYGMEAVSYALDARPDVILVAVEEPSARPLETAEALANALPDTPIVIYSSINDAEAVRRSMVFGARDYLVKPVQSARLLEAVNTVLVQEEVRQMRRAGQLLTGHGRGTVITVTGAKGGIGKTVISVNLALALHRETGKRVVILDADTQFGDVATMLDLSATQTVAGLLRQRNGASRDSVSDFLTTHGSGLEILAAPSDDDGWASYEGDDLKRIVDLLAQTHDFVVVDTAGSFDGYVRAAIEASTLALVITTGEVSSVRDTAAAIRRLESWGVDGSRVKVLFNRGARVGGFQIDELRQALNRDIFWELPYDRQFPVSVQLGQPVLLKDGRSVAARNLTSLARLIAGTRRSLVRQPEAGSLRQRLLRKRGVDHDATVAAVQASPGVDGQARPRGFLSLLRRRGAAPPETHPRDR